ncbi:AraC family transcriptional regulator [Croceivirga sp. JEA036]|uniref:AraC family transcriptional regulator n=1 Tax=Croceivirga sp. JEA036 TaxID=2721162 RepID=UPI00143B14C3|nr:AraC family transcriptional regulator [Croceivirga sp. JEA036]NJB35646.1 AraC family transcriptional regulator [Croceivirga sp. JEA036]
MLHLSPNHYKNRKIGTLVENQTSYALDHVIMHVYETHKVAEKVALQFNAPVLASMFQGKKIMHLRDKQSFDFLPGESLILPANELMCIDFPIARLDNPTQCLAMEIADERILKVVQRMNEQMTRSDGREWQLMDYNFHFTNDASIYQILQRLVYLFTENHPSKELFVDNMVQELIVRILQANSRKAYAADSSYIMSNTQLGHVVQYIKDNLDSTITNDGLAEKACMSISNFYRVFKNEIGLSPVEFINKERIAKAVRLLQNPDFNLTEIYMACGFSNRSYFNRVFKKSKKLSPKAYRARFTNL